jgi:hypothetical protein
MGELVLAMPIDDTTCKGLVTVGGSQVFSAYHTDTIVTVNFTYARGDILRIEEQGSCMIHLYSLSVGNTRATGSRSACCFSFDRFVQAWPSMPRGLASGHSNVDRADADTAWLLTDTPPTRLYDGPPDVWIIQGYQYINGSIQTNVATNGRLSIASARVIVRDVSINGNEALNGGGAFVQDGAAIFVKVKFLRNRAKIHGGAIYSMCNWNCKLQVIELLQVVLEDNSATNGGAIWVQDTKLTIVHADFSGGSAVVHGGAIFVGGQSSIKVSNATFSACSSNDHGAAVYAVSASAFCPSGWFQADNTCLKLFETALPWAEAERTCYQYGGHLASINSDASFDLALLLIDGLQVWIGLSDVAAVEGYFTWIDGNPLRYETWAYQKPDHENNAERGRCEGGQHCVVLQPDSDGSGTWDDTECARARFTFASNEANRRGEFTDAGSGHCSVLKLPYLCSQAAGSTSNSEDVISRDESLVNVLIENSQFVGNLARSGPDRRPPGHDVYLVEPGTVRLYDLQYQPYDPVQSVYILLQEQAKTRNHPGECLENPCQVGRVCTYDEDSLLCSLCPAGEVAGVKADTCVTCPSGKEPDQGHANCVSCEGLTASISGFECAECSAGTVANVPARTACVECSSTEIEVDGVCRCAEGFYNMSGLVILCDTFCTEQPMPSSSAMCQPCPHCIRCPTGSDSKSSAPLIEPGYGLPMKPWEGRSLQQIFQQHRAGQHLDNHVHVYPCPVKAMCLGEWFTANASIIIDHTKDILGVIDSSEYTEILALTTAAAADVNGDSHHSSSIQPRMLKDAETKAEMQNLLNNYYKSASEAASDDGVFIITDRTMHMLSTKFRSSGQVGTIATLTQYTCSAGHLEASPLCTLCGRNFDIDYVGGSTSLCTSCESGEMAQGGMQVLMLAIVGLIVVVYIPTKVARMAADRKKKNQKADQREGHILVGAGSAEKASPIVYVKIITSHFQVLTRD